MSLCVGDLQEKHAAHEDHEGWQAGPVLAASAGGRKPGERKTQRRRTEAWEKRFMNRKAVFPEGGRREHMGHKKKIMVETSGLCVNFPVKRETLFSRRRYLQAVTDVSLTLYRGETFGLVGESGCGKSTLGRCILRLIEPTGGEVFYQNQNLLPAILRHESILAEECL